MPHGSVYSSDNRVVFNHTSSASTLRNVMSHNDQSAEVLDQMALGTSRARRLIGRSGAKHPRRHGGIHYTFDTPW